MQPNPLIERTNNDVSILSAFSTAQPPLCASHLKRYTAMTQHHV